MPGSRSVRELLHTSKLLTPTDLAGFRSDPRGHCYIARHWLIYCTPSGALCGTVSWGRPDLQQVRELEAVTDSVLGAWQRPFAALIDVQHVDGIEPAGFAALGGYGTSRRAALARLVSRLAVVRPHGLTGVVAEGFFRIFSPPCPAEVFGDVNAAIGWLGVDDERPVVEGLEPLRATILGTDPLVLQLRRIMEASPDDITADRAARLLGLSPRTLERRLRDAGVRFKRELLEARVRVAQRRLRDTKDTLTAIAFELGFASPQHFSNAFREVTGESPSEWRKRCGG
jgi:AraC-like DNA-binding protein